MTRILYEPLLEKEDEPAPPGTSASGLPLVGRHTEWSRLVAATYSCSGAMPMGADIPWFVTEKPTGFVLLNFTTHLTDVPMAMRYINAYKNTRTAIRAVI